MTEMNTITARVRLAGLALLAAGAITAGALQLGSGAGDDHEHPLHISQIEFLSVADFSDDRRLAGFAEDVFVGRVAGEGATLDKEPVIETEFPVEVVESIKGSTRGTVVVTQQGGRVPGRNELRLMEGDRLLEPGRTYLFATRADSEGRRYLVPEFGDVPVRDAAHRNELRERFMHAVRSQIPFAPQG